MLSPTTGISGALKTRPRGGALDFPLNAIIIVVDLLW